jgi:hypothetical protein
LWPRAKPRSALQQINVILPVAGADYVGPEPQGYVDFAVGVLAVSKQARRRAGAGQVHVVARCHALHPQERHGAAAALTWICQAKWR